MKAELIDLSFKKTDPNSAEFIYSSSHGYEVDSAKEAYVNLSLIATRIRYEDDPQYRDDPKLLDAKYEEAYQKATDFVRGNQHRIDAAGELGDHLIELVGVVAATRTARKAGLGVSLPEGLTKYILHKGLNSLVRLGEVPKLHYEAVVGTNTYALNQSQQINALSKYFRRTAKDFHPDLNLDQDLNLEPKVMHERLERSNRTRLEGLEKQIKFSYDALMGSEEERFDKVDQAIANVLEQTTEPIAELLALERSEKSQRDKAEEERKKREQVEERRIEMLSTFGLVSGIAQLTGHGDEAALIDRAANFTDATVRAFNQAANISASPMTFINPYVTALNLGVGLFAGPAKDPNSGMYKLFGETLKQLHELRVQIYELGQHIDRRFDVVDHVLQKFVFDSTRTFQQITSTGDFNSQQLFQMQSLLKMTQQSSYGTQILLSGSKWLDVSYDCFNTDETKRKLSQQEFKHCRDTISLLAATSRFEPADQGSIPPSDIMDDLANVLSREIPLLPWHDLMLPQPEAWLAGTGMLLKLANEHPREKPLLKERYYNQNLQLSLERLIEGGSYFQAFLRNVALQGVDTSTPVLRKTLISHVINAYEEAVVDTLEYLKRLPNRLFPGLPDLRFDLLEQEPQDSPKLYSFLLQPVQFCSNDQRITGDVVSHEVLQLRPVVLNWIDEGFRTHPDLRWPSRVLSLLPRKVRHAVASDLVNPDKSNLKVFACLSSVNVDNVIDKNFDVVSSELKLEFKFYVEYKTLEGAFKRRDVANVRTTQSVTGASFIMNVSNQNPLAAAWNGTAPFKPELSIWTEMFDTASIHFPELDEFTSDLDRILRRVNNQIGARLNEELPMYEQRTRQAVDELSLIFERGIMNNDASISELMQFISQPTSLPAAKMWAEAYVDQKASLVDLHASLAHRISHLRSLIAAVETSSNLRPGKDIFGHRIEELRRLQTEEDSVIDDRPWYRRFF